MSFWSTADWQSDAGRGGKGWDSARAQDGLHSGSHGHGQTRLATMLPTGEDMVPHDSSVSMWPCAAGQLSEAPAQAPHGVWHQHAPGQQQHMPNGHVRFLTT